MTCYRLWQDLVYTSSSLGRDGTAGHKKIYLKGNLHFNAYYFGFLSKLDVYEILDGFSDEIHALYVWLNKEFLSILF